MQKKPNQITLLCDDNVDIEENMTSEKKFSYIPAILF